MQQQQRRQLSAVVEEGTDGKEEEALPTYQK